MKIAIEHVDSELDKITQEFDKQTKLNASLQENAMSIERLAEKIAFLEKKIAHITTHPFLEVEDRITQAKKLLPQIQALQEKLKDHTNFSDVVDIGGSIGLTTKYEAQLLSLFYKAQDICKSKTSAKKSSPLSHAKQASSFVHGMTLFKQAYKVHKAYQDIYSGLKYKKAEFTDYLNKSSDSIQTDLETKLHTEMRAIRKATKKIKKSKKTPSEKQQALREIKPKSVNPIKNLSKKNLSALKERLSKELQTAIDSKKLNESAKNSFGLLPDEIALFGALLDLPYKLQHGTNHFSDIARTGRLDSLTEIHRHRPNYDSPFSTPGNLKELGNGGFVFFRCYVDGVNGEQTRYGNTRIISDLSMLREIGWVSLHDQLVPFSSHNRQQTLYEGKRLLFKATPANVENAAQKNKSADGIQYTYRTAAIKTYNTGTKDVQKSFGDSIATQSETIKFTQEIFYGPDILPGIALSIIAKLRQLRACGYRQKLLDEFQTSSALEKVLLLGKLVKNFYRIEGKYPLGLAFEYDTTTQKAFFKPVAGSDKQRTKKNRALIIENPEGDGRHNMDLSINTDNAKQAYFHEKLREAENQIAILQKQIAKTNKAEDSKTLKMYKQRKTELEKKLNTLTAETEGYLKKIAEVCTEQDMTWVRKRSYEFLKLLSQHFVAFIQDNTIAIAYFKTLFLQKLALLTHETWINLLANDAELWSEISELSMEELEGMADHDISTAMDERGYSFDELRELFHEDEDMYGYATCDDIYTVIYEHLPTIPEKLLQYIDDSGEDIDWEEIGSHLEGSEKMLFDMSLDNYYGSSQDSDDDSSQYSTYSI